MLALFLIYNFIPFVLFLTAHYVFIKLGLFYAEGIRNFSLRTLFLASYFAFGVIFLYTNLIWSVEEPVMDTGNKYAEYEKNYVNSNQTDKYRKINISGEIEPQLNVEFSVDLHDETRGCSAQALDSARGKGAHQKIERIVYPLLKPGKYSIDIFLDNHNQETGCKLSVKDKIDIFVSRDGKKHHFYQVSLAKESNDSNDAKVINNTFSLVVCSDVIIDNKHVSECQINSDIKSEAFLLEKTKAIHLDFKTIGRISGKTLFKGHSDPPEFLAVAFKKFSIGKFPSFDPR